MQYATYNYYVQKNILLKMLNLKCSLFYRTATISKRTNTNQSQLLLEAGFLGVLKPFFRINGSDLNIGSDVRRQWSFKGFGYIWFSFGYCWFFIGRTKAIGFHKDISSFPSGYWIQFPIRLLDSKNLWFLL